MTPHHTNRFFRPVPFSPSIDHTEQLKLNIPKSVKSTIYTIMWKLCYTESHTEQVPSTMAIRNTWKAKKKQLKCTVLIDASKAIAPLHWGNLPSKSRSLPRKVWKQKPCLPKCLLYTHSNERTLLKLVIHPPQQQRSTGLKSRESRMTTSITAPLFTGHTYFLLCNIPNAHKRSEELNKVQYSLTNFSQCCPLVGQKTCKREKEKEMKWKCREVNQALTLLATLWSHAS